MALTYITITGTFDDGTNSPVNGSVTFTPSSTVYASGIPVATPATPIQAQVINGTLVAPGGGTLQLLATGNSGLTVEGRTGFWYWIVAISITAGDGTVSDGWDFFLPVSPATVDLYSTANTGVSGSFINPMTTLGDIIYGAASGTATRLAGNSTATAEVLTSTGSGSAATTPVWETLASLGFPTTLAPLSTTLGGTGLSETTAALLLAALLGEGGGTMGAELSPKAVTLTDAATVAVNASLGNEYDLTLGGNRTIGVPSNPVNGQSIRMRVRQPASGGPFTVTWSSGVGGYSFGASSAPTLSTAASACDLIAFDYDSVKQQWMCCGYQLGF